MLYNHERPVYFLFGFICITSAVAGIIQQGFFPVTRGFIFLQLHPARLLNDFSAAAGTGAALLNASSVAAVGLALIRVTKVQLFVSGGGNTSIGTLRNNLQKSYV